MVDVYLLRRRWHSVVPAWLIFFSIFEGRRRVGDNHVGLFGISIRNKQMAIESSPGPSRANQDPSVANGLFAGDRRLPPCEFRMTEFDYDTKA